MSTHPPEGRRLSPADIAKDNARLAKVPVQGEPLKLPVKPEPQQRIASLKDRLAKFKTYPAPEAVPILDNPLPACSVCGGRGAIVYAVPIGHALYGKLQKCTNPDCEGVKRNQEKRLVSTLERMHRQFGKTAEFYGHADMSQYSPDDQRLSLRCARVFLRDGCVAGKELSKRSLVFYGKAGTGKTHLMSAIHNELVRRGIPAVFLKIRTMLKGVQRGYNEDAELRDFEAEDLLRQAPVLFIDELETGLNTGDRTDIFESVVDYRCMNDMTTVIATNLEQDELADAWNHRIQSRLVHMAWWVKMNGETLRDTSPGME